MPDWMESPRNRICAGVAAAAARACSPGVERAIGQVDVGVPRPRLLLGHSGSPRRMAVRVSEPAVALMTAR